MVAEMPGWGPLLEELVDILERKGVPPAGVKHEDLTLHSLVEAARSAIVRDHFQYAASLIGLGLTSQEIRKFVMLRFSRKPRYASPIEARLEIRLSSIMNAPISGIVTTNYDNVIESHPQFTGRFKQIFLSGVNLPNLFLGHDLERRFFLKLHGDLSGDVVLSSEEYDRVYLQSPRVDYFLRACMMQRPIIFLGCSIEDAVLKQRRRLFELFGQGLPPCYQVAARGPDAEVRSHWLEDYADIKTLFYNASDRSHVEFDLFLCDLVERMRQANIRKFGIRPGRLIRDTLKQDGKYKKDTIGKLNHQIIDVVRSYSDGRCAYLRLLEEIALTIPGLGVENLFYRIAFLISIGALVEVGGEEMIIAAS